MLAMSNFGKTIGASSLILLFIGLLLFGRVDQTAALSRGSGLSDGFTARLSTSNQPYLKGEPVVFKVELSHPTLPASEWREVLSLSTRIAVIAKNSAGQEFRWEAGRFIIVKADEMGNREIESKLPFDLDTVQQIFPLAGIYDVKVAYIYPDRIPRVEAELVSAPIRVTIQEPTGMNRLAYDFYQNSVGSVLGRDRYIERDVLEARREFSRLFGASVYAKYNSFELARLYERAGEFQRAEDELYPISDVDFYYRDDIDRVLNLLAGKLGRPTPRTKFRRQNGPAPVGGPWIERPDIRPNYNIAPIPAPVLVPNPTATPRI